LEEWFDKFERIIHKKNNCVEDVYNINKTGFAIGAIQRSYMINKETKI